MNIEVRYGDSTELAIALIEEGKNSRADVFYAQDAGALGAIAAEKRTLTLPAQLLNKVDQQFRSPTGQWTGISGRVRVIDYNTKLVKPSKLPTSVMQLTDSKWHSKVGWAPTNGGSVNLNGASHAFNSPLDSTKPPSPEFKGVFPGNMITSGDGRYLYVVDQGSFQVFVIDTSRIVTWVNAQGLITEPNNFDAVIRSVKVGRYPFGISRSPDSKTLFVANVGVFQYTRPLSN